MVQREVAERIAAPAGEMSYLSVFVQYHAAASIVRRVPREAFEPAPAVESAILALDVRPPDSPGRLPASMEDDLWRLVQAGFRERRKMLHNVLPRQLPIEPATITAALADRRDRRQPAAPDAGGGGVDRPAGRPGPDPRGSPRPAGGGGRMTNPAAASPRSCGSPRPSST